MLHSRKEFRAGDFNRHTQRVKDIDNSLPNFSNYFLANNNFIYRCLHAYLVIIAHLKSSSLIEEWSGSENFHISIFPNIRNSTELFISLTNTHTHTHK